MSKILSITEFGNSNEPEAGFNVVLDDGETIKLWIDNQGSCCENWGWFMSEENLSEWIGAEVLSVEKVDCALNVEKVQKNGFSPMRDGTAGWTDGDGGGIMFVNINTNMGTLQFVAYNSHNGYYGHSAGVVSRFCTAEETV